MASVFNSNLGVGCGTNSQENICEFEYSQKAEENKNTIENKPPQYVPSPKHEPPNNWGSENPIKTIDEGQKLLDSGYKDGNQIYNITSEGKIVKFQPDNTPENGYHAYEVTLPRDIPTEVLRQMKKDGKITQAQYKKYIKGEL